MLSTGLSYIRSSYPPPCTHAAFHTLRTCTMFHNIRRTYRPLLARLYWLWPSIDTGGLSSCKYPWRDDLARVVTEAEDKSSCQYSEPTFTPHIDAIAESNRPKDVIGPKWVERISFDEVLTSSLGFLAGISFASLLVCSYGRTYTCCPVCLRQHGSKSSARSFDT